LVRLFLSLLTSEFFHADNGLVTANQNADQVKSLTIPISSHPIPSTGMRTTHHVADFWTTQCTRCPEALDKLDDMAQDPKYRDVQFISICCDKLDGARDIIERDDDLRWQNINHYFMDKQDKELAKKALGFKQVPFYVVLDVNGSIQQSGNGKQVDFEEIPGIVEPEDGAAPTATPAHNVSSSQFSGDRCNIDVGCPLDFRNQSANIRDPHSGCSSPVQVIDQRLFEMDDF
jgi:hypothetical protein